MLQKVAPTGRASEYDRQNLPIYAELLDADTAGISWSEGAWAILRLDASTSLEHAQICWESHLARARWVVGEGLASAMTAFGHRNFSSH